MDNDWRAGVCGDGGSGNLALVRGAPTLIGCKWVYSWGVVIKTASLQITPEILALIAEIDEFKGAWRALGALAPERLSALQRVATIESIGSSTRIEGSKLTDRGSRTAVGEPGDQVL
jgi:hypothetical protein